jgi:hypothetical protein
LQLKRASRKLPAASIKAQVAGYSEITQHPFLILDFGFWISQIPSPVHN